MAQGFLVLVASDGSRFAHAAVATALAFPWPAGATAVGVVALRTPAASGRPRYVVEAFHRAFRRVAAATRHALSRRWPDADVAIVDQRPADAILTEAARRAASVVVLGSRGHGTFRRILLGSVSRAVVRRARCPVLVVRHRPAKVRRFLVGLDGSPAARRAAQFVGGLPPPPDGHVTLVRVVEPLALPSATLMPSAVRGPVRRDAEKLTESLITEARRDLDAAAAPLRGAGWRVETAVRSGAPLNELLASVDAVDPHVLVIGARGAGRIERALLGSVADGALAHARIPILIVR